MLNLICYTEISSNPVNYRLQTSMTACNCAVQPVKSQIVKVVALHIRKCDICPRVLFIVSWTPAIFMLLYSLLECSFLKIFWSVYRKFFFQPCITYPFLEYRRRKPPEQNVEECMWAISYLSPMISSHMITLGLQQRWTHWFTNMVKEYETGKIKIYR